MTGAGSVCGGIASTNANIAVALSDFATEKKCSLTVLSLNERPDDRLDLLPEWVDFRAFHGRKAAFAASLFRAALGCSLLFFDHVRLSLPVMPLAAFGAARMVIFAHGSESWRKPSRLARQAFRSAALCLANSRYTLSRMHETLGEFQGVACPLGLDPRVPLNDHIPAASNGSVALEAADGVRRSLNRQFLLLVGRMIAPRPGSYEGQKGHRLLIKLLPKLLAEFPDVQLVFPGPGDDRENIRHIAEELGVGDSVFLPGEVSFDMLRTFYRDCYAFVMPSLQEGFGLVYLEAMNFGKPCVGCFDQGAEEIVVHGETGYLIRDLNDPQELLGVLRRLLREPLLSQDMGKRGFERLHRHFTSQHFQERIKEQFSSLLETNNLCKRI
jgi:glycosyltransferase involved in cell wall biosynthesis